MGTKTNQEKECQMNTHSTTFTSSMSPPTSELICSHCDPNSSIPHAVQITRFRVANLCCALEERLIMTTLQGKSGIESISINVVGRYCIVKHCPVICCAPTDVIVDLLNEKKLGVSVAETGERGDDSDSGNSFLTFEMMLALLHVVICWAFFFAGVAVMDGEKANKLVSMALLTISTGLGIIPIIRDAFTSVCLRMTIDIHVLMIIAVAGAFSLGEYFDGALVVSLFISAELIESVVLAWVHKSVAGGGLAIPTKATLAGGKTIPLADLNIGDIIVMRAGDMIAADGTVVRGEGIVDESALTGEAIPIQKKVKDKVLSGTIVQNGFIEVVVETAPGDSTISKISQAVQDVQADKGEFARIVDRFALYWTPFILLVTFLIIVVGGGVTHDWHEYVYKGITLLVLACPCSIVLAAPMPAISTIATAARNGVLIRGSSVIERMGLITTVALDKTGTLTKGFFKVVTQATMPWNEQEELPYNPLELAAALEEKSAHPLANAIVSAHCGCIGEMMNEGGSVFPGVRNVKVVEGIGLEGWVQVDDDWVFVNVGNEKLFKHKNPSGKVKLTPSQCQFVDSFYETHSHETVVCICVDDNLVMILALSDEIREDSASVVQQFYKLNLDVFMLTGDSDRTALNVCRQVNINQDNCHYRLLPTDKLQWVQQHSVPFTRTRQSNKPNAFDNQPMKVPTSSDDEVINDHDLVHPASVVVADIETSTTTNTPITALKKSHILMAGDGINDAASLAAATVGVAMGVNGSAMAATAADVVLMTDSLGKLPGTLMLCRWARQIILQNCTLSIGVKIIGVVLAIIGRLELWGAVIIDMGALLFVILNGARPLCFSSWEDTK